MLFDYTYTRYIYATFYQFFALHALHELLKEMDGFVLTEVERFLDGCDDVRLHPVGKAAAE